MLASLFYKKTQNKMEITNKQKYKQSVDEIYKSYTSKKFLKAKLEAMGARNIEIEIEKGEEVTTIKITREMPSEVPGMFKRFMKPWNKMFQTETWEGEKGGPYNGTVKIRVEGTPVKMDGTMRLKEGKKGGCSAKSITEVNCDVPFVGRKLTKFIAESAEVAMEEEAVFIGENV